MSCEAPEWSDRYVYLAEWFDPVSSSTRPFLLTWFPWDGTIELFDTKCKRTFLKRTKVKGLTLDDIYVGNSIVIYSRLIKIIDFANVYTMKMIGISMQKTCAIITPDAVNKMGQIFQIFTKNGFKFDCLKMMNIQSEQVEEMFEEFKTDVRINTLKGQFTSGPTVVVGLLGPNGVAALQELAGPEDPDIAKKEAPTSIRALYGFTEKNNAIYVAPNHEKVSKCLDVLLRKTADKVLSISTAVLHNSTCCLVKPHAVKAGHLGDIILAIEAEGYRIAAMEMFNMDHVNAAEFLEVYNGILPEYQFMVEELITGGCVAMEIIHPTLGEKTASEFRKFCGPSDPDVGRQLRPDSLRAKFGLNKIKNAIHTTDLPEDATLEVEYFFRVLQL